MCLWRQHHHSIALNELACVDFGIGTTYLSSCTGLCTVFCKLCTGLSLLATKAHRTADSEGNITSLEREGHCMTMAAGFQSHALQHHGLTVGPISCRRVCLGHGPTALLVCSSLTAICWCLHTGNAKIGTIGSDSGKPQTLSALGSCRHSLYAAPRHCFGGLCLQG